MNGQQELTPKSALIILNTHIDNVIKGTCGKEGDEPSWGLNEINSIINCIGTVQMGLNELELLKKEVEEKRKKEPAPAKK
jgi:hypothetical protein